MIVPATQELLREYYGDKPLPTVQAYVYLENGKPVGVAGFIRIGHNKRIIFSEAKPGVIERYNVTIMKFTRFLLQIADENGWTLVADPDESIPNAKNFLAHFGFKPGEDGEYIR